MIVCSPSASIPLEGHTRPVEHLRVNGWFLRPGSYLLEVTCDGASARTNITVHSPIRRTNFKLINWGRSKGKDLLAQDEDSLGFNLLYGLGEDDKEANLIRAGVDFISCCTMGGGHQMDLRQECDWSDPDVIRGGTRRVARRAFIDRTPPAHTELVSADLGTGAPPPMSSASSRTCVSNAACRG